MMMIDGMDWATASGKIEPDQLPGIVICKVLALQIARGVSLSALKEKYQGKDRILLALEAGISKCRRVTEFPVSGEAARAFLAVYSREEKSALRRIGKRTIPVFYEGVFDHIHEEIYG